MLPATPSTHLEARISTELHGLLKRAADSQNRTKTDFVASAVPKAAERSVTQAEVVELSRADQERFARTL